LSTTTQRLVGSVIDSDGVGLGVAVADAGAGAVALDAARVAGDDEGDVQPARAPTAVSPSTIPVAIRLIPATVRAGASWTRDDILRRLDAAPG
jgi:hypothetical protein